MQTETTAPTIALGYVRVSTARQELSVEAQSAGVERAAEYHKLPAPELFVDADTSGSIPFAERPGARQLIERVRQLAAQSVLVIFPKVDRLGRSAIDIELSVQLLEQLGARMMFLDINVDTRTPQGRAFMQMAAIFAQLERATIRERIQTALDQKRDQQQCTGTVPYGWDAVETGEVTAKGVKIRRLEPNALEQKWILQIYNWRSAGLAFGRIARELNRLAVPTKTGAGNIVNYKGNQRFTNGKWSAGKVHKLLNSKTVQDWLQAGAQSLAA